jgi:hypothetical protein
MVMAIGNAETERATLDSRASHEGWPGEVLTPSDLGEVFTFRVDLPERGVGGGLLTG